MIKAIFFDIDGTLVSFDTHRVPESAVKALKVLREKGIKVFIATGRHLKAINNLGDLEFDGYITLNGSYCIEGKDKVIYKHPIASEDIQSLMRFQHEQERFPCIYVQENNFALNYEDQQVDQLVEMLDFPREVLTPLTKLEGEVYQLIAFFTPEQEPAIMAAMPGCEATRWYPSFADVIPQGSGKHIGIDKVCDYYGFSVDECMAFGDGGNDKTMLACVGTGVAMGNAADDVKAVANYATTSVDEDGIANALKHFGLID